ncbi:hypothetical protein QUF90_01855 [Desulfococcaceae bacterium HSG9]|nr:hypothetical protein [Desulfococcaceae bacterium HSG9]
MGNFPYLLFHVMVAQGLRQVMNHVSEYTTQDSGHSGLNDHIDGLRNVHEFTYVVADSALHTEETLKGLSENLMFISRIPETLTVTKDMLKKTDATLMHRIDENH